MKKVRFTEAQIMGVLRQAEGGLAVRELCREHGISSATFYKWRAKYRPDLHPVRQATAEHLCRALQPDGPARMAGPLHL